MLLGMVVLRWGLSFHGLAGMRADTYAEITKFVEMLDTVLTIAKGARP